jgi:hypothetical protein
VSAENSPHVSVPPNTRAFMLLTFEHGTQWNSRPLGVSLIFIEVAEVVEARSTQVLGLARVLYHVALCPDFLSYAHDRITLKRVLGGSRSRFVALGWGTRLVGQDARQSSILHLFLARSEVWPPSWKNYARQESRMVCTRPFRRRLAFVLASG